MDESKVIAFIKCLSKDTANGTITWQRLNDYQNPQVEAPAEISLLLFESEYRHIDFHNSYLAIIPQGDIYVLHEDNESGRDGGIHSIGYKIYLRDETSGKIEFLPCPASAVYQLLNAVNSCINNSESLVENFIDRYLSQNRSDTRQ